MKTIRVMIHTLILLIILAACSKTNQITITPTELVQTETQPLPTMEPVTEEPQKFPLVYTDETAGIQIFYPEGWTTSDDQVIGERGSQTMLLSPGSSIEKAADGGARIILVTYQWEPKNDLDAFVAQRKTAWEASGFMIQSEEGRDLGNGKKMMVFQIETTDDINVIFAFTTSGEDYLQISGDGDLELCRQILEGVKLIQS